MKNDPVEDFVFITCAVLFTLVGLAILLLVVGCIVKVIESML